MPKSRSAKSDDPQKPDTKTRILDAAMETLHTRGFSGATARAIADVGGFNQALIFYHFGSVNDLLLAAVDRLSDAQRARYRERIEGISTLSELVSAAEDLLPQDVEDGSMTVLAQMLSSSLESPEQRDALKLRFEPWIELLEDAVGRVSTGTPYEKLIPRAELARMMLGMFMGMSMFTELDELSGDSSNLFGGMRLMAMLIDQVLDGQVGSKQSK